MVKLPWVDHAVTLLPLYTPCQHCSYIHPPHSLTRSTSSPALNNPIRNFFRNTAFFFSLSSSGLVSVFSSYTRMKSVKAVSLYKYYTLVKQRLSLCTYGCMQNISIGYKLYIRHLFLKYCVRIGYYNLFSSIHVLLILSLSFKKFYICRK